MDFAKSVEDSFKMVILGTQVLVDWQQKLLTTTLDPFKAEKWRSELWEMITKWKAPVNACKLAGRLSSTVTAAHDRIGRAFVKPFYAQAYDPHDTPTITLIMAASWWYDFLAFRPRRNG